MSAVCPECEAGNHGNHEPSMGGICIGCACPVQPRLREVEAEGPIRDTAKMSADLTPEGLRVEFAASGGAKVRLRLNSYGEAMQLIRNLLDATCARWPTESAEMLPGGRK